MRKTTAGFTLVELMFSMLFVSLLIISITLTSMHIVNVYNRGMLIKEVNQLGRTITDQMQRTVGASVPNPIFPGDTFHQVINPARPSEGATGGRLCLGNYSYIWNYAKTLKESSITTPNTKSGKKVGFIRVADVGGQLCVKNSSGAFPVIPAALETLELLPEGERGLKVYSLNVSSPARAYDDKSLQRLYYIDISIGTSDYRAIEGGRECKPPTADQADQNYCAINSFSFAARTGSVE